MWQYVRYYNQFQGVKGRVTGLPGWGRALLTLFAAPGLLLLSLSIFLLVVSIAVLFLLTLPVYRLLQAVTGGRIERSNYRTEEVVVEQPSPVASGHRRQVDVKIIE